MQDSTVIGQYDLTTGKAVYFRLIRRDHRTAQDHVLSGWQKLESEAAMRRYARANGAETIERGEA